MLATLEIAVPIAVEEVRRWSPETRERYASSASQTITEKGDVLQFGGKKGEAAKAFAALARGLALLSFAPGGVAFCGLHWETKE